ncbi:cytochrome d ubiquinol oxidase subunit II [Fulvivirga sp. 29W222]|uniref:Cytochrome d ubiquinol oxidase subunit II n=1 Tax=Fulvivirga marina TaxID=2494733 RepID=A0A937KD11_9BACT|nr:cytochrome d ubiquinol oxidase subunit II [Fulvivirga marina]MBL6445565.1 cytochrome d ubiquinol oxidase subunit II [Fulvivirga marina]
MLYVVIAFLSLSILFYLLFGGADFGAGIVELITKSELRQNTRMLTYKTIGPIWEANHMWLVIIIVILFVGFPPIYSTLSIYLHIPLLFMLLGIIGRGTAFVFRHYDAVKDDMQRVYNLIFTYSSFITPFFLGIIAGAMISGNINPDADNFYALFIAPWTGFFPITVGIFTVCICGFLAAVYLSGEETDQDIRQLFIRKARLLNLGTVLSGAMVFFAAYIDGISQMVKLVIQPVTLIILTLASLSLWLLWHFLHKQKAMESRLIAGFQVTMILLAIGYHYFPNFLVMHNGTNLSLINSAAMGKPITTLAWALILGSIFILPSLFYLIYSFQKEQQKEVL